MTQLTILDRELAERMIEDLSDPNRHGDMALPYPDDRIAAQFQNALSEIDRLLKPDPTLNDITVPERPQRIAALQRELNEALGIIGRIASLLTEAGVTDQMSLPDRVAKIIGERDGSSCSSGSMSDDTGADR